MEKKDLAYSAANGAAIGTASFYLSSFLMRTIFSIEEYYFFFGVPVLIVALEFAAMGLSKKDRGLGFYVLSIVLALVVAMVIFSLQPRY